MRENSATILSTIQPINLDEHRCPFSWCEGTIWPDHHIHEFTTETTGRDSDVEESMTVTVLTTFIDGEDPRPRILLHFGAAGSVDVDVSPTASEARRIAIKLLAAADHLDQGGTR